MQGELKVDAEATTKAQQEVYKRTYSKDEIAGLSGKDLKKYNKGKKKFDKAYNKHKMELMKSLPPVV